MTWELDSTDWPLIVNGPQSADDSPVVAMIHCAERPAPGVRANLFYLAKHAEQHARLIAAAPDLLAALEGLFEHCAMVHKHWGDGSNAREAEAAQEVARAAIAKVKGALS